MEFMDVIQKRKSIRKFTEDVVPDDIIEKLLETARLAPTWANMQGVRFVVVKDPEKLEKVKSAISQGWVKGAKTIIVVCIEPRKSGKNTNGLEYYTVDAAICAEHIVLACTNFNLGCCWVGFFKEEDVISALNIPKRTRVIALLPIGYPAADAKPVERKSLSEIAFRDEYGKKWEKS